MGLDKLCCGLGFSCAKMAALPGIFRLEANAHYIGLERTQSNWGLQCSAVKWLEPSGRAEDEGRQRTAFGQIRPLLGYACYQIDSQYSL